MPELPEVEVVRAGLAPAVTGATILGVEVFELRSLKRHDPLAGSFESLLTGRSMQTPARRGKFLWIPLDSSPRSAIVAHLGMSGQILLRDPGTVENGLLRIRLYIEHPEHGELWVHFVDQRLFGSMAVDALVPTVDGAPAGLGTDEALLPAQVSHIARDPLDPVFDDAAFAAVLARRRSGIKRVLLDQTLISGIGNIYADESLWAARIHYDHPATALSRPRVRTLLAELRRVLGRALAEGGTSFDAQYVNVNGASGYFSRSLHVYGRQGQPCDRCGTAIVRESFMNRGSHFCPRCQRM
ncbi:formamidopyrimidine-DNA glycosylase [Leifsonia xyli subsp. xyli]|uniref:Formamidopyrimidine-DNA glycosylase n=2 Tax=Leifsonia xyli subsp. xyli TaxID=59736 RepID=FPG_LEIXX|nr:bifunctional DNA-formamidopyrimidine glycosylase/DNA-(apurinic or apyrimidinic site) lyase [Leifsonia xyli]Q6AFJ3.3 RecName: Full=Formamidopyrimidine-DNA glycosylase; Short=Fapy-DNA glycosylase; AltName: Full=DNA-(apurinic or apyrimidinic site) lyase MutM; Short=AP lyase MutM [Leifsonia xyli subsp. xyli str. CTCB07]AAT88852.1 formamidopyrimidine-DNA glycosylase [Leifsonia xyli subsp. xyli str. CTCB07]ODA90212.1 formamidopyrimidine-DNA glycosylase [Leifsonia xyli subsp. xyli]